MATFIWPPEVQWPPPAHITANYDVVAPGGALLSSTRASEPEEAQMQPYLALITPLSSGGHPDQGLPWPGRPGGGGGYPDQGLPGGPETQPPYPDQGLPGRPPHVGNRPPGSWGGEHPGNRPPGSWDRPEYPSTGPVRPGRPIDPGFGIPELGDLGPAHPWVPPSGEELPPPPEDIADQVVVAVWRPDQQAWKVAVAQGPHPAPTS